VNRFKHLLKLSSYYNNEKVLLYTIILAVAISLVHFFTYNSGEIYLEFLHELLTKLYFIPVLIAAFFIGKKGAIQLSFTVSLLYIPHSLNTQLFSGLSVIENISEIILIWTIGIVSGVLTDKLKKIQTEKARLAALEKVSTVINVVNKDIVNDYLACTGLTKSFEHIYDKEDGNTFTVKLLLKKLEHLGSHITHLSNLAAPKPVKKIKYNISHLTKKCVKEVTRSNPGYNLSFKSEPKLPPVYMDVRQIEFAVKQILQSFIEQNLGKKELAVSAVKNNGMVEISLTLNGKKTTPQTRGTEVFDLIADPEKGYLFALASSIIRSHNGDARFKTGESGIEAIYLYMPVN